MARREIALTLRFEVAADATRSALAVAILATLALILRHWP